MKLCHSLLYFGLFLDRQTRVARASLITRTGFSQERASLNTGELGAAEGKIEHLNTQEGHPDASVYGLRLNQNQVPIGSDNLGVRNFMYRFSLFATPSEDDQLVGHQELQETVQRLSDLILGIQGFETRNLQYWENVHQRFPDPVTRPRLLFDDVEHGNKMAALVSDATKLFIMAQDATFDVSGGSLQAAEDKIRRGRLFQRAVENAQLDLMKSGGYVDLNFAFPEYRRRWRKFFKALIAIGLQVSSGGNTSTGMRSQSQDFYSTFECVRKLFGENQQLHRLLLDFQEGHKANSRFPRVIEEELSVQALKEFLGSIGELGGLRHGLFSELLAGNKEQVVEGVARASRHILDAKYLLMETVPRGNLVEAILSDKEYQKNYLELQNQIEIFETGDYLDWASDESNCRVKFQILTKAIKSWYKDQEDLSQELEKLSEDYRSNHKDLFKDSSTLMEPGHVNSNLVQNSIEELNLFIRAKIALEKGSYKEAFIHLKKLKILGKQGGKEQLERVNQGLFHRIMDMNEEYQSRYKEIQAFKEEIKSEGWYLGADIHEAEKRTTSELYNLYNSIRDFDSLIKEIEKNPDFVENSDGLLPELVKLDIMKIQEITSRASQNPKSNEEFKEALLDKSLLALDKMNQVSELIKSGKLGLAKEILEEAAHLKQKADILRAQSVFLGFSDIDISFNSPYNSKCQDLQESLEGIRVLPGRQPEVAPGQTKIIPGQTEIIPGQTEIIPGQAEVIPGKNEVNPEQSEGTSRPENSLAKRILSRIFTKTHR